MAQLPENDRIAGPYVAEAGQTDFPGDFPLIKAEGLRARRIRDGIDVILSAPDLAAVDVQPSEFTARLASGCEAGDILYVYSDLPAARERAHSLGGAVRTPTLEGDAEEFQAQLQEVKRDLGLVLKVNPGQTPPSPADLAALAGGIDGIVDQAVAAGAAAGEAAAATPKKSTVAYAALAAVAGPVAGQSVYVGTPGQGGTFIWREGDFTSPDAVDVYGLLFVPSATVPVSAGCWVREREGLDLNIEWGGARPCLPIDTAQVELNTAVIRSAVFLAQAVGIGGVGAIFTPARFLNFCHRKLKFASLTPLAFKGQGAGQGTLVAPGLNGSVWEYVPAVPGDPGEAVVIETLSPTPGIALTGLTITGMGFVTPTQTSVQSGKGVCVRGVYGNVDLSNLLIAGFATGMYADDDPSAMVAATLVSGVGSTRNGKFKVENVHITQAAKRRFDLRACASVHFIKCVGVEEPVPNYQCDLHIGQGTRGGRSDDLIFDACQFIGAHLDPSQYPENNVLITGAETLIVNFTNCTFEQAKTAGVKVVLTSPSSTYTNVTATNCHWNGQLGYFLDSLGARTVVINPMGQAGSTTDKALFRFRGADGGTTSPQIGGGMIGGNLAFVGTCGVEIDNARGVKILGTTGGDYGGRAFAVVKLGPYSRECSATDITPIIDPITPPTFGVRDLGVNNSFSVTCGVQAGAAWGGGPNQGDGRWVAFSTVATASSGAFGAGLVRKMRYLRRGNSLIWRCALYAPDAAALGTASGTVFVTLPVPAYGALTLDSQAGAGRDLGPGVKGGLNWTVNPQYNPNLVQVTTAFDNSFPLTAGTTIAFGGEIELSA